MTDPRGQTTIRTYDSEGHLLSSTTPVGGDTSYTYDNDGRHATTVEARGNVSGATAATFTTSTGYDPASEPITVTDPLGDATSTAYDPAGRVSTVTDPDHHATSYGYDLDDRVTTVLGADATASGKTTTTAYDGLGDVTTRTDPNAHATTYSYDPNQRLTGWKTATGQTWTQAYDLDGDRTSEVTGKGNTAGNTPAQTAAGTITQAYDTLDRLTATSYGDGTPTVSYGYDTSGRVTSMADGAGTQTRSYDNADRLTGLVRTPVSGPTETYAYSYDADGDVTSRTLPDNSTISSSYDNDDRPTTLTADGASTTYGYDVANELTSATLPSATGISTTWAYDGAQRLTTVDNEDTVSGTSTPLSKYVRTLDAAGNPLTLTTTRGSTARTDAYAYDPTNRLTKVCYTTSTCTNAGTGSITWAYDLAGNRTSETRAGDTVPAGATGTVTTTSSYDNADELTQAVKTGGATGTTTYGYDANGNQTLAGSRTTTSNLAGQLTSSTIAGNTTIYSYDGLGDRRSATIGATSKTYSWDPNNTDDQLATDTVNTNGTVLVRSYRYTPATGDTASYTSTGTSGPLYDLTDDQGSISDVTSNTGSPQWAYTYEPFGQVRTTTKVNSTAPVNPIGYTSAYTDLTSGLVDLRARQYDPSTATFTSRDPISQTPSTPAFGTYTYADNQPELFDDPTGEFWDGASNFIAGFGDTASLGLTHAARNLLDGALGSDDYTDYHSGAYAAGSAVGATAVAVVLPSAGALAVAVGADSIAATLEANALADLAATTAIGAAYGGGGAAGNAFFDGECASYVLGAGLTGAAGGAAGAFAGKALAAGLGAVAETADEALPGVVKGWARRTANSGKGTVWQEPGATGNANSIRVMDSNTQYPDGYVRFYNEYGQPIGLDGKPGPNSATHIPRGPDGNYPVPKGWGQ